MCFKEGIKRDSAERRARESLCVFMWLCLPGPHITAEHLTAVQSLEMHCVAFHTRKG